MKHTHTLACRKFDDSHFADGLQPTPTPYRVGKNGTSIVSDFAEGITIRGGTGADAIEAYGGNLIAESLSPGNAQFLVEAANFYARVLQEARSKVQ